MNNSNTFTAKLRDSGLRSTKQRIKICQLLFKSKKTFHFTINDLAILIKKKFKSKSFFSNNLQHCTRFQKKRLFKRNFDK